MIEDTGIPLILCPSIYKLSTIVRNLLIFIVEQYLTLLTDQIESMNALVVESQAVVDKLTEMNAAPDAEIDATNNEENRTKRFVCPADVISVLGTVMQHSTRLIQMVEERRKAGLHGAVRSVNSAPLVGVYSQILRELHSSLQQILSCDQEIDGVHDSLNRFQRNMFFS